MSERIDRLDGIAAASELRRPRFPDPPIGWWLVACAALVFAMIMVGGITRLSHAGLSIVEWKLVTGVLPPLSDAAWQAAFDAYRQFPEYQQLNRGMSLAEFQDIYWWEYTHRLLGRTVGFVFALPLLYFAVAGRLSRSWLYRMGGLLVLGGLQGALGWYMVKSGLVDRPDVSHYRLAAHFGLAVALLGALLLCAFEFLGVPRLVHRDGALVRGGIALCALVFVTLLSGALVAGLDAGFLYNSFPLMEGHLVPPGLFELDPWYLNPFENRLMVQFQHRCLALGSFAAVLLLWRATQRRGGHAGRAAHVVVAVAFLQVMLGIATLLLVVPVPLAALHQAMAVILFASALWFVYIARGGKAGA